MRLQRIEGWEGRLADFVVVACSRSFVYGEFDCCLMPCEAVEVITGVDPLVDLRGRYKTELGALRVLRRFAGGLVGGLEFLLCCLRRDLFAHRLNPFRAPLPRPDLHTRPNFSTISSA